MYVQDIGDIALDFCFELLFAPFETDEKRAQLPRPARPLVPVSSRTYRLRSGSAGMSTNEYLCVGWDTLNMAELDVLVHTAFTGYTTAALFPMPAPCGSFIESSFGCYATSAADTTPFSIADLIEASKKKSKSKARRGSERTQQQESSSHGSDDHERSSNGHEHGTLDDGYKEAAHSLLAPLFATLDKLDALRTASSPGAGYATTDDAEVNSSDTKIDVDDVYIDSTVQARASESEARIGFAPTSPVADRQGGDDRHEREPQRPQHGYSAAVQRAVFEPNVAVAVSVVCGYLTELRHYDQKLQLLGKLVRQLSHALPSPSFSSHVGCASGR